MSDGANGIHAIPDGKDIVVGAVFEPVDDAVFDGLRDVVRYCGGGIEAVGGMEDKAPVGGEDPVDFTQSLVGTWEVFDDHVGRDEVE